MARTGCKPERTVRTTTFTPVVLTRAVPAAAILSQHRAMVVADHTEDVSVAAIAVAHQGTHQCEPEVGYVVPGARRFLHGVTQGTASCSGQSRNRSLIGRS